MRATDLSRRRSLNLRGGAWLAALALVLGCSSAPSTEKPSFSAGTGGSGSSDASGGLGGSAEDAATDAPGSAGDTGTPGFGSFGRDTPGGRGGTVRKVTSLNASGPGSLREALAQTGPRIIVFEVGGVIDLKLVRLDIVEPFVTIAGQTAPSPGITLIRGGLRIMTHDVRIQHVRVRMGDAGALPASGFEPDVTTDGSSAYNVVIDHCSVAWGVDENLSVSGPRFDGPAGTSHRVTIESSIIAEGLRNSIHEKGAHSMGSLVHDYCTDIAVVGNLYAHNDERSPWFKGFATGVVVNNVVYNPGKWAMRLGPVDSEWTSSGVVPEPPKVSIVGNYMRHGMNTLAGLSMVGTNSRGAAYLEDNIAEDTLGGALPIASAAVSVLAEKPAWPEGLVARPAQSVVDWVLAHAGARPKDRDSVDQRLIADFLAKTGAILNSQSEVGGYPSPAPSARALELPTDNIEGWLKTMADELE